MNAPSNLIRTASTQPVTTTGGGELLRTLIALAIVVAAVCVLRWLLKKISSRATPSAGSAVQIISRTPISARQSLLLVRVGRRVLLTAESSQQVTTLCEITNEDEIAEIMNRPGRRHAPQEDFASVLQGTQEVGLATTQEELSGLIKRVRVLSQHFKRA